MMRQLGTITGLITLGLAMSGGAVGLATCIGDEPKTMPRADDPKPLANPDGERPGLRLAEKLDRLKAEYDAALRAHSALYRGSTIPEENEAKAREIEPDYSAVVRRIFDLAATAPKDPAVRDALLWMIMKGLRGSDGGPHAGEFALAASTLVRDFGDDPDAVRVGLELDSSPTARRDLLLLGFYASARGRESKGLAQLALAQYLERKAMVAQGTRKVKGRPTYTHENLVRADGTLYSVKEVQSDEDYAYLLHLKQCDVGYIRDEAERLYGEVIAEYGDVPYTRMQDRLMEALLKQPEPRLNGKPLTDEARRKMEARLARRSTLGQVAEARLDDWHNLAVGKTAPEIKGVDVHGKPLMLSDYRGKVVALIFWGSWCGPCMAGVPRERDLVERLKGKPFALLGVDCEEDKQVARAVMQRERMTWPTWYDGAPGEGPIARRYHIQGYPTTFVLDAKGVIRYKGAYGGELDRAVDELLKEVQQPTPGSEKSATSGS